MVPGRNFCANCVHGRRTNKCSLGAQVQHSLPAPHATEPPIQAKADRTIEKIAKLIELERIEVEQMQELIVKKLELIQELEDSTQGSD